MVDNHFLSADLPLPAIEGNHRFTQIVRHSFPEKLRNKLLYEEYPKYRIDKLNTTESHLNTTVIIKRKKILQRRPLHPDTITTDQKKTNSLLPEITTAQQSYYPYGWPVSTATVSLSNRAPASTSNRSVMSYISLPPLYTRSTSPTKEKLHKTLSDSVLDEPISQTVECQSETEKEKENSTQSDQENRLTPDVEDDLEVVEDDVADKSDCLLRKPVVSNLTVLSDILNTRDEEGDKYEHILREHGSKLLVDSTSYQSYARKKARINTTKST